MARTQAADYESQRAAILENAAEAFAEAGYAACSMTDIARKSGASKARLYHYYESKEAILYDLLDRHTRQLLDIAVEVRERAVSQGAEARDELHRSIAMGLDGYGTRMQLAEIAAGIDDRAAVQGNLEIASSWDPSMADPLRLLLGLARKEKRADDELALLRRLAQLDQHDRALHAALLDRLAARGLWDEARRAAEAWRFVEHGTEPLLALARALSASGRRTAAVALMEDLLDRHPACDEARALLSEWHEKAPPRAKTKARLARNDAR
jgi:AcrR family transcriptional regulator